jgi:hypothetical protein
MPHQRPFLIDVSRLIWRAWDAKGGEQAITRSVLETINKFENELQRKLD